MSHTSTPLSCLEALVGLRGACPATDTAAVYVDQLGVTALELRDYLTASSADVGEAFAEARRTATQVVALRMQEKARRLYRPGTLLDQTRAGYLAGVPTYEPLLAGRLGGYVLELDRPESYLTLQIPTVGVQVEFTGPVTVSLLDLDQGVELANVQLNTVDGIYTEAHPHWRVEAPRRRRRVMVAIDRSNYRGVKATAGPIRGGCSTCSGTSYKPWTGLTVRAATIAGVGPWNYGMVQTTSTSAGLTVLASVACDHEAWLCGWSRSLALPLAYATCREVYDRALRATYGERLTARTADPERLKQLRDEFDALAAGSLATVVDGAVPPLDETCYVCDRRLRTVTALP